MPTMDALEQVVATILRHDGYWVWPSYKVSLDKATKRRMGKPSTPRWEIDVLAYKGGTNELLAIECKAYLDSPGVHWTPALGFRDSNRYKLFTDASVRDEVLAALKDQVVQSGACAKSVIPTLVLAAGKITSATRKAQPELDATFARNGWRFFPPEYIRERIVRLAASGYHNDVTTYAAKLLLAGG